MITLDIYEIKNRLDLGKLTKDQLLLLYQEGTICAHDIIIQNDGEQKHYITMSEMCNMVDDPALSFMNMLIEMRKKNAKHIETNSQLLNHFNSDESGKDFFLNTNTNPAYTRQVLWSVAIIVSVIFFLKWEPTTNLTPLMPLASSTDDEALQMTDTRTDNYSSKVKASTQPIGRRTDILPTSMMNPSMPEQTNEDSVQPEPEPQDNDSNIESSSLDAKERAPSNKKGSSHNTEELIDDNDGLLIEPKITSEGIYLPLEALKLDPELEDFIKTNPDNMSIISPTAQKN